MYVVPEFSTFADTYQHLSRHLIASGVQRESRGLLTLDSDESVCFKVKDDGLFHDPIHSTHLRYLAAEFLWYLSRDLSVDYISKHATLWSRISDEQGLVNSNYGYHMLGPETAYVLDQFLDDPNTRKAVMVVHEKRHHHAPTKDLPCTMHIQFQGRPSEASPDAMKLSATVVMRSSDIHFGIPFDVPWFRFVQKQIAMLLNYHDFRSWEVDDLTFITHSLHMYEKDIAKHSSMVHTQLSPTWTPNAGCYLTSSGGLTLPDKPDTFLTWLLTHAGTDRTTYPHPFHKYRGEFQ